MMGRPKKLFGMISEEGPFFVLFSGMWCNEKWIGLALITLYVNLWAVRTFEHLNKSIDNTYSFGF